MFTKTVIASLFLFFSLRSIKDKSCGKKIQPLYNLVISVSLLVFELWLFKEAIVRIKR